MGKQIYFLYIFLSNIKIYQRIKTQIQHKFFFEILPPSITYPMIKLMDDFFYRKKLTRRSKPSVQLSLALKLLFTKVFLNNFFFLRQLIFPSSGRIDQNRNSSRNSWKKLQLKWSITFGMFVPNSSPMLVCAHAYSY